MCYIFSEKYYILYNLWVSNLFLRQELVGDWKSIGSLYMKNQSLEKYDPQFLRRDQIINRQTSHPYHQDSERSPNAINFIFSLLTIVIESNIYCNASTNPNKFLLTVQKQINFNFHSKFPTNYENFKTTTPCHNPNVHNVHNKCIISQITIFLDSKQTYNNFLMNL